MKSRLGWVVLGMGLSGCWGEEPAIVVEEAPPPDLPTKYLPSENPQPAVVQPVMVLDEDKPPEPVVAKKRVPKQPVAEPVPDPNEPPKTVNGTVKRNAGDVDYCYQQAREEDPSVGGRIVVSFVAKDGRAQQVTVVSDNTGDAQLATCVTRVVRRWKFYEGIDEQVEWSFVFRRG